jgi:DNA-binding response OmpR family regulator
MPETKGEKVLIIEGDVTFGETVSKSLSDAGYKAILVKNGAEAVKSIEDNLPHLIIMNIVLPGADSYDVLAKKQAEPLLAKLPVFLVSTQGVPINMRRVPAGSVTEFIIAFHADPNEIVTRVNRHFGHEQVSSLPLSVPDGNKLKLLWVEDDKLIGTILAKKLISSGFDLFHANNGKDALDLLREAKPDVIVLDLILPEMSGFDILQKIKMDTGLKNIPVMILSNLGKPSDLEKARMLGANKFLVKAASSLDEIVAEIKGLCRKA